MSDILWTPSAVFARETRWQHFQQFARTHQHGPAGDDYPSWHRWSLNRRGDFWAAVWDFTGVTGDRGTKTYRPGPHMTDAKWFCDGRLNFAENLLHPAACSDDEFGDAVAVCSRDETGHQTLLTRRDLLAGAARFAAFLRREGVCPGDRVVALLPNVPLAVVAMLGTAAVGAVWSSCSPDFGEDAIVERFGQLDPVVLVTTTATTYAGKRIDVATKATAVRGRLPTVRALVTSLDDLPPAPAATFVRFPFDHPLFALFSSGTTGPPKGIVHGAGGTLLQHLKEHQLHTDIRSGDRLFYYTTTGWMMWNWLASALASRATILLYDGSPLHPDASVLWALAARHRVTHFGASAKYYAHLDKLHVRPRGSHDLSALRCVLSTGSPLLPASYDYVYRDIKADVNLASISGGTDIVSCFALGCPTEPVRRGELQVKGLGMDVRVFDDAGHRVVGEPGELVCASPFPSMPVSFWNDPEKAKYRASYFERFENVWHHGDFAEETPTGGLVITGRSDTTLNPGGVRIGTAEIYRQVEAFPEVVEALATVVRRDGDERIVLFVRLRPGDELTAALSDGIRQRLRERCSPRHVPAKVLAAPEFPRTVSGKLSEVAVRNAINGLPVKNESALANPESLGFFRGLSGSL